MKDWLILAARVTPTEVGTEDDKNLEGDLTNIVNVIIGLLGIVAVITIIFGGVNYMTANGDSSKIKKAKETYDKSRFSIEKKISKSKKSKTTQKKENN